VNVRTFLTLKKKKKKEKKEDYHLTNANRENLQFCAKLSFGFFFFESVDSSGNFRIDGVVESVKMETNLQTLIN